MPDRQGADARRDAFPGQIVRFGGPGARALDQEGSILTRFKRVGRKVLHAFLRHKPPTPGGANPWQDGTCGQLHQPHPTRGLQMRDSL